MSVPPCDVCTDLQGSSSQFDQIMTKADVDADGCPYAQPHSHSFRIIQHSSCQSCAVLCPQSVPCLSHRFCPMPIPTLVPTVAPVSFPEKLTSMSYVCFTAKAFRRQRRTVSPPYAQANTLGLLPLPAPVLAPVFSPSPVLSYCLNPYHLRMGTPSILTYL